VSDPAIGAHAERSVAVAVVAAEEEGLDLDQADRGEDIPQDVGDLDRQRAVAPVRHADLLDGGDGFSSVVRE
jgi:hypothetical protein